MGADAMLRVDLLSLSDELLQQLVSERCAKFGFVKHVKIVRGHDPHQRRYAT